ncbi:MAG: hypothetical protein FP816_02280 [Desulfobacteraceae bacterium]|nr:hypothetical protein [Desulfobacteraceae bacterium]MBU4001736.1 hypothetical protein [Pseudomonadota bacterium]
MTEELEIPENLLSTYRRLIKKAPSEQKEDVEFQKKILIYLKAGGEKLAKQRIELTKQKFQEGYLLINRLVPDQNPEDTGEEEAENEDSDDALENEVDDDS